MKWNLGGRALSVATVVAMVIGIGACGGTAGKLRNIANGTAAKRIENVQKKVEAAQKLEYTADYESKDSSGQTNQIHVAQKPPKSSFKSGDTQVINDGTNTYTCTKSGSDTTCVKTEGTGAG